LGKRQLCNRLHDAKSDVRSDNIVNGFADAI